MTTPKHTCDNCGKKWRFSQLAEIKDYFSRVDEGGTVPSGECPECGCLCYPEDRKVKKQLQGERIVISAVDILKAVEGLTASILDGNKNPSKDFVRALRGEVKNTVRNLKKLVP